MSDRGRTWLPPVAAVVLRLLLATFKATPVETFEYEQIAQSLLAGRGYALEHLGTTYRGYSNGIVFTLVTAAAAAVGHPVLVALFQYVCAGLLALVVARLARRLGAGPSAALLAGLVAGLHPAFVYYDVHKRHPLGLDALLIATLVLLLASARSNAAAAGAGAVLGLSILERLTLAPMAAVAPFWLVRGTTRGQAARRLTSFYGPVFLLVAPWAVRNAFVFGRPILSTMTAEYLFVGNVPPSLGSYHLPSGTLVLSAARPEVRTALAAADERGQAEVFGEAFRTFAGEEPARLANGMARKLAYFWTWAPQTGVLYPPRARAAYLLYYGAVLTAALAGAIRAARAAPASPPTLALIAVLALVVSVEHAVLVFEMRHRWALEPLMIAVAATCGLPRGARAPRSAGSGRRSDGGALR